MPSSSYFCFSDGMKRVCTPDIFLFPKFSEAYICFPFFAHPYLVSCNILCSCYEKYKASRENSYPSAFEQKHPGEEYFLPGVSFFNVPADIQFLMNPPIPILPGVRLG